MTLCLVHLAQPQQPLVSFSAQVENHPGAGSEFCEKANSVSGGWGVSRGPESRQIIVEPGLWLKRRVCLGVGGCWGHAPTGRASPGPAQALCVPRAQGSGLPHVERPQPRAQLPCRATVLSVPLQKVSSCCRDGAWGLKV